jgi:hypothetical protein
MLALAPNVALPPPAPPPTGLADALAMNSLAQTISLTYADDPLPPGAMDRLPPAMRAALSQSAAAHATLLSLVGQSMRGVAGAAAAATAAPAPALGAPLVIPSKYFDTKQVRGAVARRARRKLNVLRSSARAHTHLPPPLPSS